MNETEAYLVLQKASGIEAGDTVRVIRKAKTREMGWCNGWNDEMDKAVGKEWIVTGCNDKQGMLLSCDWYSYPFFCLEIVEKANKLPDPIEISSAYSAKFNKDRSIQVGCQHISFDLLERIYLTAKGIDNK